MRTFQKTGLGRMQSQDGVAIHACAPSVVRYESHGRYCDLYQGHGMSREGEFLLSVDLQGELRTGSTGPLRQGVFWIMPDGSKVSVTAVEKAEMVRDLKTAYQALGDSFVVLGE